jgi:phenylpyruvate tautomerase PptA (4-oxalocrotonate tautomerase family)
MGRWRTAFVPSSQIEIRRQYSRADEVAIIDAVHESLVAAFKIPPGDKHVRLVVHEPHRFATAPRLAHPEFYTLVTIDCFAGRSLDAKRSLYREIVNRLTRFGIPDNHVTIVVRESATENWGIRGGRAAFDVDLGFDVHV